MGFNIQKMNSSIPIPKEEKDQIIYLYFQKVDKDVGKLERRFDKFERRFDKFEERFNNLENKVDNSHNILLKEIRKQRIKWSGQAGMAMILVNFVLAFTLFQILFHIQT